MNPLFFSRWLMISPGTKLLEYPETSGDEPKARHVN
jgi:hypothetical protein